MEALSQGFVALFHSLPVYLAGRVTPCKTESGMLTVVAAL
jgi:hypothetical protein